VLQAAVRAFAAAGYAGTSVHDILKATGLSKPTLYYYFESKEGLFRAILAFAYDESFRRMQAATAGEGTCAERLVKMAAAVFAFATEHRDLMRLVFATIFAAPGRFPMGSSMPGNDAAVSNWPAVWCRRVNARGSSTRNAIRSS
jgi:AcrR family transcriptional regulator